MKQFLFLATLVVFGPAAWAQTVPPPAATDFKSDICAECKMAVTNKSYAAQMVSDGKPLFFDDIGCLVQYERQGQITPEAVKARYVRSVAGNGWLEVDTAVWVTTKDVRTPMGYGFHAFADKKAAEAFIASHKMGRLITWADVQKLVPDAPDSGSMDDMGPM